MREILRLRRKPYVVKLHCGRVGIRGAVPKEIELVTGLRHPVADRWILRIIRRVGPIPGTNTVGERWVKQELTPVNSREHRVDLYARGVCLELDDDR